MQDSPGLPPNVFVRDEGPESVRYVLPLRDLKYGKWLSFALLILGFMISVSTIFTVYAILASVFNFPAPRTGRLGGFFFVAAAFGAPMTWGGLAPFWWGLVSFLGHREIEVKDAHLLTIERCGPFWRSKRWKVDEISSFEIKPLSNYKPGQSPPPIDVAGEFNALLVHPTLRKHGMVAWGYPIALLVGLARVLAARCNQAAEVKGFGEANREPREPIYVYGAGVAKSQGKEKEAADAAFDEDMDEEDIDEDDEEWSEEVDSLAPVSAPVGTTIRIDRLEGGEFTITVPPAGLWKGSKGLFAFGLLWSGAMTLFTVLIGFSMLQPKAKADMPWFAGAIFGLFWLVGIGMLLGAINMGRRRAAIALASGQLMAIQTGIFGSKKQEWPIETVADVCTGPSGMEVNKVPILELHIIDQAGKKFGLLSEREDEELRWLAYEIRQSLPAKAP
jgi:hypothetical protein